MAHDIEQKLRDIGTPEEQIEGNKLFLLWLHDNDYSKVCEALDNLKLKIRKVK